MPPPVNLIVGRALINAHVQLTPEAPDEIEALAGQQLHLKFPYRFDKTRREWEGYVLRLQAAVDGGPERQEEWRDHTRQLAANDRRGVVELDYPALPAGEHELRFAARASYAHGPRGDPIEDVAEGEGIEGTIRVIVRDPDELLI